VDLENVINMQNGVFWIVCNVTIGVAALMPALFLFNTYAIRGTFPSSGTLANLKSASDTLLPVIGNILFLPIVSILMEVFMCRQTSGDDLSDSYLDKDCYATCWTGEHVAYAIVSGFILLIYLPIAVYMRPKWQEYQHDLHIMTLPRFLILKSIFQVFVIAISKTFSRIYPKFYAAIYITSFAVFLVSFQKARPYSY
jgi:hypothetical protein